MYYKTLNSKIVKTAILKSLLVILSLITGKVMYAQNYDVYVANRALTASNVLEFDVYVKNDGASPAIAFRSYQCGYKFAQAFVNGGTLTGAYITGSSDLPSTFGKTWGFSWNATNRVLSQSANTGSTCPGYITTGTAAKIGRFRVTNSVNFGCADDSLTMMRTGSGFLLFAISKYNTTDCSDPATTVNSSQGITWVEGAGSGLVASASAPATLSCGNDVTVNVTATGGFGAYTGTGAFLRGEGSWSFPVSDGRGCQATASATIAQGTLPTSSTTTVSACDSYDWNGVTHSASGSYTATLTNAAGCDSSAIVDLTITASSYHTTTASACDSYTWSNNSATYTQSGVYTGSTTNCVTELLDLTIIPSSVNTTTGNACDSYTWAETGQTYTASGTYTGGTADCVTQVLDLTITASTSNSTTVSACDSYTWSVDGWTYTLSGIYVDITGCHTETLNLTITASTSNTTVATACDSYTWSVDGNTYTQSGQYSYVTGCHTEVLDLTVTVSSTNTSTESACDSYYWAVTGETYTQSGGYTGPTVNCVTQYLVLTITASSSNSTTESACGSYTWTENGQTYTQSGSYSSVTGCHTEVLVLTITPTTTNVTSATNCDSYTWADNGQTYTQSGTYTGSTTNCVTEVLNLTISGNSFNVTNESACDSYTWSDNGQTYTQSGSYTGSTSNCVTEVLNLTINTSSSGTAGTVSGVSSLCAGQTSTFTTDGDAGGSWSSDNESVATVNSATGVVTAVSNGTANITYTVTNACGVPLTASGSITVAAFSVSAITGPTNSCPYQGTANAIIAASNATYSVAVTAGASYDWVVPSTATIMSGQGTNSIQVHFASTYVTVTNGIKVTVGSLCGDPAVTKTFTVVKGKAPLKVVKVYGFTNVCNYIGNGETVTYTVNPVPDVDYYSWLVPAHTTITAASPDSSSITVTFASAFTSLATTAKAISVSSVNGCGKATGFKFKLTHTAPLAAVKIFGPTNVCLIMNGDFSTGKDTTYYVNRINGASAYSWTVPSGMEIISRPGFVGGVSSGDDTLIVVRVTTFTAGSVVVTGSNNCGTGAAKSLVISKLNPSTPGSISGKAIVAVCPTLKYYYKISALPANTAYLQWTIPAGAILDSISPNMLYIRVIYPAKGSAYLDTVRVQGFNSCGASAQRKLAVNIPACAVPPTAIAGNTIKTVTGSTAANLELRVYPNPTTSSFRLQALSSDPGKMEVRIMDVQGRKFSQAFMMPGETLTLGSELKPGAYMVEVLQGNKTKVARVIKL